MTRVFWSSTVGRPGLLATLPEGEGVMKFLILTSDYPSFLRWLYGQHPGLSEEPYAKQMRMRVESLFGGPHIYCRHLTRLGHEAHDVYSNNGHMQKAWARENGLGVKEGA